MSIESLPTEDFDAADRSSMHHVARNHYISAVHAILEQFGSCNQLQHMTYHRAQNNYKKALHR